MRASERQVKKKEAKEGEEEEEDEEEGISNIRKERKGKGKEKKDEPLGCNPTAGILCIAGSAINLIGTGISKSHTRMVLSSLVVTKRRLSSTKVIVLTGPRCWLYSCVISPERMSYCERGEGRQCLPHGTTAEDGEMTMAEKEGRKRTDNAPE